MAAAFTSLKHPDYRLLWWAGTFSFLSVQMQFLLRGVLAWDLTERDGAIGLVFLVLGISILICTPLGGVASDRYPKRKVLLISQGALVVGALSMGAIVLSGHEKFWMLLIASAIQGAGFGFFGPTRVAFTSELIGREHLGNAISLSLLSMSGTRIFAPSLAGVLVGISFVGIGGAYLVSATMSFIGFCIILRLPEGKGSTVADRRNPFLEIVDGVRYVNSIPELRRVVLATFFVIMFAFNYVSFIPALVEDTYGLSKVWVGILSSASAIGAVLVSIPLAANADSPKAKQIMLIAGVFFGFCVIGLGLAPSFWWGFAAIALIGVGSTTFQTLTNTQALSISDDAHQGRVQSLIQLSFAGFGIAAFPLGVLAEKIGRQETIMAMGVVAIITMMALKYFESVENDHASSF